MIRPLAALALLLALPAAAQEAKQPTTHDRAIAAGYKALTLCSALFNAKQHKAERTVASVEANELKGIYPEYDALIGAMPATVGTDRVAVEYDAKMPPRVAIFGGMLGCRILPIGTPADADRGTFIMRIGHHDGTPGTVSPTIKPLLPAMDAAFDQRYGAGSNTTGVLINRDGTRIAERYAPGFGPETPQRTWSVAKSIAGTLIGIAVGRGALDVHAPAPIPEWQTPGDPRAAITLDNLLRMASGLHSDTAGNRTDAVYFGGIAVTEETVDWPLEVPQGTRFRYANNDILLAIRALRFRLDDGSSTLLAHDLLLDDIGARNLVPERDWKGNYILSSQAWASARDLMQLGELWRQDGKIYDRRILPEGWMKYMTTPSGPQPATGPGYGATLWLFGPAQGLPEGSFAAQGNRGQFIMVVPSKKLVIVRRGEDSGPARFDIAKFTADVIVALK